MQMYGYLCVRNSTLALDSLTPQRKRQIAAFMSPYSTERRKAVNYAEYPKICSVLSEDRKFIFLPRTSASEEEEKTDQDSISIRAHHTLRKRTDTYPSIYTAKEVPLVGIHNPGCIRRIFFRILKAMGGGGWHFYHRTHSLISSSSSLLPSSSLKVSVAILLLREGDIRRVDWCEQDVDRAERARRRGGNSPKLNQICSWFG